MQIFLTIVIFLLIFSVLILIHEFGHFYAAKRAGVKVEEFGMGLPPRIFGIKKGETLYSINWIPFGGFVRMLGEDGKDSKNKRSFQSKKPGAQLWIVSAGVVMNFLLAFVLLTFGLWLGIEPLWTSQDDLYDAIRAEEVHLEPGMVVVESNEEYNTVKYLGEHLEVRSFDPGDRILEVEGLVIYDYADWEMVLAEIEIDSPLASVDHADGRQGAEYLTTSLLGDLSFAPISIPRLIYKTDPQSVFANHLIDGDVIMEINGYPIIDEDDLMVALGRNTNVSLEIYRPGQGVFDFEIELPVHYPLVSMVMEGAPASEAGIQEGDKVMSIGGQVITASSQVAVANAETKTEDGLVQYQVLRDGSIYTLDITVNEENLVGIALADRIDYYGNLSLYPGYVLHSLIEITPQKYGLFKAPVVAVSELWRLGKYTAVMFFDVFGNFLGAQEVPDGVAGPVGIAQMTFVAVQDGFSSVLRFVALLSLSLGVVNILPIPALDGGRAVFIIYRGFTGRKPNAYIEHWIHMTGFFLLLIFIAYITFNDILNLF